MKLGNFKRKNMDSNDPINSDITSGEHLSLWVSAVSPIAYFTLKENEETDVLVIGAGIAGLTTAYCLRKAGYNVILIDDGYAGSGETGRTTGHLTYALDNRYAEIERLHGTENARLAAESHKAAIDWIEKTVREHNINCHFRRVDGYLFLHPSDEEKELEKEFETTRRIGLDTVMLNSVPGVAGETGNHSIKFPNNAQFHVMMYMKELADVYVNRGGKIFTQTKAVSIKKGEVEMESGCKIKAKHIVVATNTPMNDRLVIHTKQFGYRTYAMAARVPKGKLPYALWWDTGDKNSRWISQPYHYARLEEYNHEYDLLITGGEDHRVGQSDGDDIREEERYDLVASWTKKKFPMMENIEYKWSGQIMEPLDGLAFIGKNPGEENVYIITGDSGNGLTHATIAGMLLTDLISGKENPWTKLYDPARVKLKAAGDYLRETGNMAAQYIDWISSGDVKDTSKLKLGQGGIISAGFKKFAVYRDVHDKIHAFSAVCPHLGCIVQWNDDEKSFDCPCHGSRFTTAGKVVNGPSTVDLKQVEIRDEKKSKEELQDEE
jgi:glycine/D-amino acid oxidase-like deaminating enzyme/nitrite reductase/ring-hydroxylating ferredoxin subunit